MTASKCKIVVLHTDQGMGTLVKIYEEINKADKLTHLALIDLGCQAGKKGYAMDAIDQIDIALGEMPTPSFDFIVISHQDDDHWSLLPELSDRMSQNYPNTKIKIIYRGGLYWGKKSKTALNKFVKDWNTKYECWTKEFSGYDNPKQSPKAFEVIEDVNFGVLMVNAYATKSKANGTSAVIAIHFGGSTSIIPGDATSETLAAINTRLKKWTNNPVQPCYLLTAPHHGALYTLSDNFNSKKPGLNNADEFEKLVANKWLAASAGYKSKFHHPFDKVIGTLSKSVASDAADHTYVFYNTSTGKWSEKPTTDINIFTTIETLKNPPVRKSWVFTMHPSGLVTFESELTPASLREQAARGLV